MPLNDGAISQILPFCTEGTEADGDLLSLADYTTATQRLRGHQKGMALRELQNRSMRQVTHIAAGLAQYIANRYAAGVSDDGNLDAIEEGLVAAVQAQIAGAAPPNASTTVRGLVELATVAEATTGTDTARAVTPAGLAAALAAILAAIPTGFTTGDAKLTLQAVADAGWVFANDGSIGNAASGASTRANADCEALFALLWTNIADAWCPVQDSGGATVARGATASADWAANRRLVLPRALGRALAVAGGGNGLSGRSLGQYLGEESHTLSTTEMPSHTHNFYIRTAAPAEGIYDEGGGWSGASIPQSYRVTTSAGDGGAHNNMQPTSFWNVMIKL